MSTTLFFGQGGGNALWQFPLGADDDGAAFQIRALSNRHAPAGAGGEATFPLLYLTVQHTMGCTLRVTPIVDGVACQSTDVVLQSSTELLTEVFEIGCSRPVLSAGVEVGRVALRGTWAQALVESVGALTDGLLEIASVEIEHEIVRETKKAS